MSKILVEMAGEIPWLLNTNTWANCPPEEEGVKPPVVFESANVETLYNLTVGGIGVSFVPFSFIPDTAMLTPGVRQTPVYFFSLNI